MLEEAKFVDSSVTQGCSISIPVAKAFEQWYDVLNKQDEYNAKHVLDSSKYPWYMMGPKEGVTKLKEQFKIQSDSDALDLYHEICEQERNAVNGTQVSTVSGVISADEFNKLLSS